MKTFLLVQEEKDTLLMLRNKYSELVDITEDVFERMFLMERVKSCNKRVQDLQKLLPESAKI